MSKVSCEYCRGVICYCMFSLSFFNCSWWRRASSNRWWVSSVSFRSISLSLSASSLKSCRSSYVFLRDSLRSSSRRACSAYIFSFISSFIHCNSIILRIISWRVGPSRVAFRFWFISTFCCSVSYWNWVELGSGFTRPHGGRQCFWSRKVLDNY